MVNKSDSMYSWRRIVAVQVTKTMEGMYSCIAETDNNGKISENITISVIGNYHTYYFNYHYCHHHYFYYHYNSSSYSSYYNHHSPVVGTARILPPYSLRIIKDDTKGWSKGSGKPFLCIFSMKKQGTEDEGRVMSP